MRKAAPIIACTPERWTKRARFALKRVRPLGLSRIGSKRNGSRSKSHECSAMLTVLKDAARRLCRWQVAILDHSYAFALVGRWSGRRDGQIQSNKGIAPKALSLIGPVDSPRSVRSQAPTRLLATLWSRPSMRLGITPSAGFRPRWEGRSYHGRLKWTFQMTDD